MNIFPKLTIALTFLFPLHLIASCDPPNSKDAIWKDCDMTGKDLSGKTITGNLMENIILNDAILDNTTLDFHGMLNSAFNRASLRNAKIKFSDADSIEFKGADMRGAEISGYRYGFIDFNKANLEGASITVSRIRDGISFKGAILTGTRFGPTVCGSGPVGQCVSIKDFNMNYKEAKTWPSAVVNDHSDCENKHINSPDYAVEERVDLDRDGVCNLRVRQLGNHGSYPSEYYYLKYDIPHGDEVSQIKYYSPQDGKYLQIEMVTKDGKRILYRNINGVYQEFRVDYFEPDYKSNQYIYKSSSYPVNESIKNDIAGEALYHNGEFETAIEYFKKAVAKNKHNFKASNNLSLAYYRLKKYEKSIGALSGKITAAAVSDTQKAAAFYNIARAQEKLGRIRSAHSSYLAADRFKPRDVYKRKAKELGKKVAENDRESDRLTVEAKSLIQKGNTIEAAKMLDEAFETNRINYEACFARFELYMKEGDTENALRTLESLSRTSKFSRESHAKYYAYLSKAQEKSGHYSDAIRYLKKAQTYAKEHEYDQKIKELEELQQIKK